MILAQRTSLSSRSTAVVASHLEDENRISLLARASWRRRSIRLVDDTHRHQTRPFRRSAEIRIRAGTAPRAPVTTERQSLAADPRRPSVGPGTRRRQNYTSYYGSEVTDWFPRRSAVLRLAKLFAVQNAFSRIYFLFYKSTNIILCACCTRKSSETVTLIITRIADPVQTCLTRVRGRETQFIFYRFMKT